ASGDLADLRERVAERRNFALELAHVCNDALEERRRIARRARRPSRASPSGWPTRSALAGRTSGSALARRASRATLAGRTPRTTLAWGSPWTALRAPCS